MEEANKFNGFNDDELYMLKRALIESSYKICCEGNYNDDEIQLHNDLLNESIDEIKRREYEKWQNSLK